MPLARLIAAALLTAALAGCGGPEPAAQARDGRVEIVLDDFYLSPQRVRAPAGRLTFAVANRGRLPHNLRARGSRGEPLAVTTLLPGASATETVTLRAGEYKLVCTVANHEELGMTGRLLVR